MSQLGIPVDIEKSEISSGLNSFILSAFGLGLYTAIYFGTIYIYFTKSSSRRYLVPITITVLFLCNTVQSGVQWYATKWQFVDQGDTRDSIFVSLFDAPHWTYIAVDILSFTGFVLADGLLIWRCFFVWDRSFRVISMSLFLIFVEIALFFVQITFAGIYGAAIPPALLRRLDDSLSAAYFATLGTSLLTTVLIAYRVYSTLKQEGVSARRFKHVIDIVVQSGATYSLMLLASAINGVLPGTANAFSTRNVAFSFYTSELVNVIAGMSATILVARVSMLATESDTTFPSTSVHLSGLQFHIHSSSQTASPEEMGTYGSVSVDRNLVGGEQDAEGKVQ